MTAKILVLGQSGQMAMELAKLGPPKGFELVFAGRARFDLAGPQDPDALIAAEAPAAVINAAAYTAVDRAECEPAAAFRLNRDAPAALARACARRDIPLVHVSTDYVFDGRKPEPYVETDPVAPMSVYGRSKAEGEAAVLAAGGRAVILRTSWAYSVFGSNFVKTMLRLARERPGIGVVDDQIGRPTWAEDCAGGALRAVQALLDRAPEAAGILHLSGAGDATWADFARAIFEASAARGGPTADVRPITTADYPTAAARPANSRLDCSKITSVLQLPMRPWREGLAACLDEMEGLRP
jgi:dTDP-4-dehydrorhamnose reductase